MNAIVTSMSTTSGEPLLTRDESSLRPRVCFERGGERHWVSTATPDGRPLLLQKKLLFMPEVAIAGPLANVRPAPAAAIVPRAPLAAIFPRRNGLNGQ
jgi:hypothetical protein